MNLDSKVRHEILQKLQHRNSQQYVGYATLIQAHNKLFENSDNCKSSNIQLTVEVEQLKRENLELQISGSSGGGGGKAAQALEQKVYKLKDELTELHKSKGENAQKILDLNSALQEKEKELLAKDNVIAALESKISGLQKANQNQEQSIQDLTVTNQTLTDEQQALQIAYIGLEEKFRRLMEENNELVSRWMASKSQIADRLNEENDHAILARRKKMQKDLEDAAKEPVVIEDDRGAFAAPRLPVYTVTIPERAMQVFDAHDGEVNAVKWSPTGKYFATGGTDRKLKLWEASMGKCESKGMLIGCNAAVMSIEFDLEETHILAASNDFACRVWTISDQRLRHTFTGHGGKVLAAKFLEPLKIVSGSHDRTLKIWDLRSRACIKTIFAGSSANDLVSIDNHNIISGHFDRKVRFWDIRADSTSNEIGLQGRVTSLDLSVDKTTLLACAREDSIVLIDLRMNQISATLSADGFRFGCDWSRAVFSPDGEYVMAGSSEGALYIWNVAKGRVEKVLREHRNPIVACSWSPKGNALLSCDKHRTVVYWADF